MSRITRRSPATAILDTCVLVVPGIRDLLLSCADAGVYRPVWQAEIENEVLRNTIKLLMERKGMGEAEATARAIRTLDKMNRAFPGARTETSLWVPLVPKMTCDADDRHVLAVALGVGATHVVTDNNRHFPSHSLPPNVLVQGPDEFLCERLDESPDLVMVAVDRMARRRSNPPMSTRALAETLAGRSDLPKFGAALLARF